MKNLVADYDIVDADGPSGSYSVQIYRVFDASELNEAGLERFDTTSGKVWIGATDPDFTSVYFLSSTGVGLRLAHTPHGKKATSTASIVTLAEKMADRIDGKVS